MEKVAEKGHEFLVKYIEQHLGLSVDKDKHGNWRVEVRDQNPDEIKIKRARKSATDVVKKHECETGDDDARELAEFLSAEQELQGG